MFIRNLFGYILGFIIFVILIPAIMFILADNIFPAKSIIICGICLAVLGILISIWTIIYMKCVGKGNPMDAFNYEIAPRTCKLMTEGPYKICRNPMLFGILIYYFGILIYLWSIKSIIIFLLFIAIILLQVHFEEKRLEKDFGNIYLEYKKKTKKIIPFLW